MRWVDFELQEPRFAALGRDKLAGPGVVLVGTIRKDGSPRISPVEPLFCKDLLYEVGFRSSVLGLIGAGFTPFFANLG